MGCGRELGASSGVETAGILGWGKYQTYYSFLSIVPFFLVSTALQPLFCPLLDTAYNLKSWPTMKMREAGSFRILGVGVNT
ncbi:uncharacterized protein CCOS01_11140 [Colletotrichum costaricense]|uniref:Uncharacterized protein n=2 Tax=Colletotrichum acutatum species complex TaxID=2707335 RepID=A0AAJ0DXH4_9PEZI|nr:uncharacterized protein CCOS01_11140 [Colletotrichum costaricense]XP_060381308.1 uncharacterized protein CTAM01_08121 [Colletotrichum tamarilloi]KAK1497109.1 hypothetical protein CTAM01_08121 [Colletotrichum tamarilloi]KAK1519489.1 hypothetical protein CCOS01_11140 [Colletotrichum costaricense]